MKRIPIRNTTSENKVKPRVFDLVKNDDSEEWRIEIQNKKGKESIPLSIILTQIMVATASRK